MINKKYLSAIIYGALTIIVLLGAYFKISHKPFGTELVMIGLVLGTVLLVSENTILKKKLKEKGE